MRVLIILVGLCFLLPDAASADQLPWILAAAAATVFAVTAWKPVQGLLILAGLLPLATPLGILVGFESGGAATGEVLLLAFLSAACVRFGVTDPETRSLLAPAVLANVAVVVAAALVGLGAAQLVTRLPVPFWREVWHHVLHDYFSDPLTYPPLHIALTWIEALALAVVVERLLRSQPASAVRVSRMLLIGVAGAAAFTANRLLEVFIRNGASFSATAAVLSPARIGVHWPDINAIGSFYALFAVPTIWLAWRVRNVWLWVASALLLIALWFAGSRAATSAAAVGVFAVALLSRRSSRRVLLFGTAAAALVFVLALSWAASRNASVSSAYRIRVEMGRIALQLASRHPGFGVGLGRFQQESIALIPRDLLRTSPGLSVGENAHNNFLQILAEEGWIGAAAFVWLLLAPVGAFARTIRRREATPQLTGLLGGIVAFLGTCLAGHPFLTPQVLWFFFLALGLACGFIPVALPAASLSWQWRAALAFAAIVTVSVPFRLAHLQRSMNLDGVVLGASPSFDRDGDVEYRTAGGHSIWYVPAASTSVLFPMRISPRSPERCRVTIALDGGQEDPVLLTSREWQNVRYALQPDSKRVSRRFDLRTSADCQLMVGRLVTR